MYRSMPTSVAATEDSPCGAVWSIRLEDSQSRRLFWLQRGHHSSDSHPTYDLAHETCLS